VEGRRRRRIYTFFVQTTEINGGGGDVEGM
jgi:hypothetical protein